MRQRARTAPQAARPLAQHVRSTRQDPDRSCVRVPLWSALALLVVLAGVHHSAKDTPPPSPPEPAHAPAQTSATGTPTPTPGVPPTTTNNALLGVSGIVPNPTSGWGLFGAHLLAELATNDALPYTPVMLKEPTPHTFVHKTSARETLVRLHKEQQAAIQHFSEGFARADNNPVPFPVLHGIFNTFLDPPGLQQWGTKNVALCFLENTRLTPTTLAHAKAYDLILTGATWTTKRLREQGLGPVETLLQGVDTSLFSPNTTLQQPGYRVKNIDPHKMFVVFSGGKLELRKGQDLVVAAMRVFMARHDDVALLTNWHNFWPETMSGIDAAGHVNGHPDTSGGAAAGFERWVHENGIDKARYLDIGPSTQERVAMYLNFAHVGLFPNRAEGGTNLVAMEAMSMGLPVILANGTGHADILDESLAYGVPTKPISHAWVDEFVEEWMECDVGALVDALEHVYQNRQEARTKGRRARKMIKARMTWPRAISHISDLLVKHGIR